MDLAEIKWDAQGLVTVVVQDHLTGEICMVAHADAQALQTTMSTGFATFFSRSRQKQWQKGETSGNTIRVREVWVDCDGDVLIYAGDPAGPSCHTGAQNCFFRSIWSDIAPGQAHSEKGRAVPLFVRLEELIKGRSQSTAEKSYTKSLLQGGAVAIGAKVTEEADEFAQAIGGESNERVRSEAADVIYHLLVGLVLRGEPLRGVAEALAARLGISGHDEKAARQVKS